MHRVFTTQVVRQICTTLLRGKAGVPGSARAGASVAAAADCPVRREIRSVREAGDRFARPDTRADCLIRDSVQALLTESGRMCPLSNGIALGTNIIR